jgi:hypothetical protein
MTLQADPSRERVPTTGIYIRAQRDGRWGSYDLAHLTAESVRAWLRRDGDDAALAINVVCVLLGHPQEASGGR